ncbi:hypothetical protein Sfulv_35960 [Streptomyces fulvorobeus]|uniref:Uncharacterized protein n=1 Tax=Streptomyces fulvorobeus TaxID=284028 RepID=A0A7J0C8C5_9ACTN|nr:hypothetical protein Sfulv_35960 [Streptomyces fulvorobeus]
MKRESPPKETRTFKHTSAALPALRPVASPARPTPLGRTGGAEGSRMVRNEERHPGGNRGAASRHLCRRHL